MGLATVYGIIKQHGGLIDVKTELGHGTTFEVYLPTDEQPVIEAADVSSKPAPKGKETILFAEDDETVRHVAVRVLKDAGYHVIEAQDGEEAVRLFKDNVSSVDLVILDLVMPKLNTNIVKEQITAIGPETMFLYSTGYGTQNIDAENVLVDDTKIIQKPYDPRDLLYKVREVLDTA